MKVRSGKSVSPGDLRGQQLIQFYDAAQTWNVSLTRQEHFVNAEDK